MGGVERSHSSWEHPGSPIGSPIGRAGSRELCTAVAVSTPRCGALGLFPAFPHSVAHCVSSLSLPSVKWSLSDSLSYFSGFCVPTTGPGIGLPTEPWSALSRPCPLSVDPEPQPSLDYWAGDARIRHGPPIGLYPAFPG